MKKLITLLVMILAWGLPGTVKADLTISQIVAVLNNGSLRYMPNAVARFSDAKYLQLEQYLPEVQDSLNSISAKNLTTKYIPLLFDCDDIANVAYATCIEEIAGMLWGDGVHAAVPVATVGLHNIYTKKAEHMINLFIFQGKAFLYDFGSNSPWSLARLELNNLAIGHIQF